MQVANALFQYCTQNWNSMTALEQTKTCAWRPRCNTSLDAMSKYLKYLLSDKTFVWKAQEMPLVASLMIKLSEDLS